MLENWDHISGIKSLKEARVDKGTREPIFKWEKVQMVALERSDTMYESLTFVKYVMFDTLESILTKNWIY